MKQLQYAAGAVAIIAASWLLMLPVSDTTTYVRSIAYTPTLSPEPRASIIFGGDMMFDRSIRTTMEQQGEDYVLSCISELLKSADLVVANLEGPITTYSSKSVVSKIGEEGNFTFTFPTSTAALLIRHNIRLVNIGNNHILNFGREGLQQTLAWLDERGVHSFGDISGSDVIYRTTVHSVPLSFIGYNEFGGHSSSSALAAIREEQGAGRVVVVYAHWGDEYASPPERVKILARQFVDAGANIVVGSHPHIVQEKELYRGAHIYYSLGNFIFDQYWNKSVRRGLLLRVEFTPTGVSSVEEIPIDNQIDRRSCAV
ncbi:CapA family protein [Candidatus Kaiserbacteria bacterium]|nr:CapA family protein [Candidatus Kaiserbacteria bacterium]